MDLQFKSEFLKIIHERGFIYQATDLDGLDKLLSTQKITAYIGFDATADSFHVGNLVQIMLLYWLQKSGHTPLILMGGGTTKIGDPTGKDELRKLITNEKIKEHISSLCQIFHKILKISPENNDAKIIDNDEWLSKLNYPQFLRDYGPHFTINRMLSFESVRQRLEREHPLTFLEFNYMILQAYDFLELFKRYDCRLELGGADQWGNIINGVELVRRKTHKIVFGLTTPLITTSSGTKMGKTSQGAVWLNSDRLSPYDYWQFWRNTEDQDVGRFLRLFTTLPLKEITKLEQLEGAEINESKKILADCATEFIHGKQVVIEARRTADKIFEAQTSQQSLEDSSLPTILLSETELKNGVSILELFIRLGLTESKSESRRLIKGGGARLNDNPVQDELLVLTLDDFKDRKIQKLSAGKKRHGVLKLGC